MAISKELEMKGSKKPILLKGTGQSMCLEVKIGSLGLEIWNFPNEEAQSYARLIFEVDQDGKAGMTCHLRLAAGLCCFRSHSGVAALS